MKAVMAMSETLRFVLSAAFMAVGIAAALLGTVGVFKFHFVLNRMHCASIIDTMGIFCIIVSLIIACANAAYIPKLLLILALLWIGSPLCAHLVSRMEVSTDETLTEHAKIIEKNNGGEDDGNI